MRETIDRRAMAALSLGHCAADFASGALPALLPYLVSHYSLSYTLAAAAMLAMTLSSSIVQPLFGAWSDRRGALWLLPAGVALCGVAMAVASAVPGYGLVLVFIVLSGLGSAAFHPEGSKFAAYVSGRRRATGMSLFSVGGNLGYGLGAAVTTPIVAWLGLRGGVYVAAPCILVAALLLWLVPYLRTFTPEQTGRAVAARAGDDDLRSLTVLLLVILFRSLAWFGLLTFVPLYEVSLGHSKTYGNHLLSVMVLVGAAGTLLAGPAADRFGRRAVMLFSSLLTPPLIAVFILAGGLPGVLALALIGPAVVGTFGVTMVMSQEYLPTRIGMASGLSIGFSIGLGGIAAVALGAVADSIDLRSALWVCAAAPLAAAALCLRLPARPARRGTLVPGAVAP